MRAVNQNVTTPKNMASPKKKATAKPSVKFRDLKSNKSPKGGYSFGGSPVPSERKIFTKVSSL